MASRAERKRTQGTAVTVIAAKTKLARSPEGQHGQVVAPTPEAIRAAIEAQTCPFCGRGPYRLLALHTNQRHGIDRHELRDLAEVSSKVSICAPEVSEFRREVGKVRGISASMQQAPRNLRPPRASVAGLRALRDNRERLVNMTKEQRSAAGKIGGPLGGATRGAQLRKPRQPCVVCGERVPWRCGDKTDKKTCSDQCLKALKSRRMSERRKSGLL